MQHHPTALSRRRFVACGAATLVAAGVARDGGAVPFTGGLAGAVAGAGIPDALVQRTLDALTRHAARIWSRDIVAIVDFGQPSVVPRFHLVDLLRGITTSLLVAHGRGSDPDFTGMLQSFSNVPGSLASSEGAYLTDERYDGIHGTARRLIGLDPSCDQAMDRAIVIHAAAYVGPDVVARQGKLGRSDGCFALSGADMATVTARLGTGRLIYAGRV